MKKKIPLTTLSRCFCSKPVCSRWASLPSLPPSTFWDGLYFFWAWLTLSLNECNFSSFPGGEEGGPNSPLGVYLLAYPFFCSEGGGVQRRRKIPPPFFFELATTICLGLVFCIKYGASDLRVVCTNILSARLQLCLLGGKRD